MKSQVKKSYGFSTAAFFCFLTALALVVLLRLFETPEFLLWYNRYTEYLVRFELWIQNHGATFASVIIILANYVIKAFIPWFPLSCICVASAVLFKWYIAIVLNLVGVAVYFTAKFYWGRKHGGGNAEKILAKYDKAHNFIDSSKAGSKIVLFFARLIPVIPIGSVSVLYGSTEIKYVEYIGISLLGFLYKIVSYVIIGRNVFDPATAGFIVPFIPLLLVSGFVLLSVGEISSQTRKLKIKKKNRLNANKKKG